MQGVYTYIPETNCVPKEYIVAAILLLLFMVFISLFPVLNLLYFYISTLGRMCAVPNMVVFCRLLLILLLLSSSSSSLEWKILAYSRPKIIRTTRGSGFPRDHWIR